MKKSVIFSHTDLDGLSSLYLVENLSKETGNPLFPKDKVFDYRPCTTGNYGTINTKISNFVNNKQFYYYDSVFITDLAPTLEVFTKLVELCQKEGIYLKLIDHHETSKYLQELYPEYVYIVPKKDEELTSATSLIYDYFSKDFVVTEENKNRLQYFKDLAETVRMYDTWDWVKHPEKNFSKEAKLYNDLFVYYKRDEFFDMLNSKETINFTEKESLILEVLKNLELKTVYKETREENLVFGETLYNDIVYKYVMAFSTSHINDIADSLKNKYSDLDFVIVSNGDYLSFRNEDDKVNLAQLVEDKFNGGGHPNASGCKVPHLSGVLKDFLK